MFKSCKSPSNRTKLQRNLNNIGVRSFILSGAPIAQKCQSVVGGTRSRRDRPGFMSAPCPQSSAEPALKMARRAPGRAGGGAQGPARWLGADQEAWQQGHSRRL